MRTYRFDAVIEAGRGGGAWVRVPLDVEAEFGTRGQVKIKARFEEWPHRGSLTPMGAGVHVLGIRKAIRAAIGKDVGDRVTVEFERDAGERAVDVPPELELAFGEDPRGRQRFDRLSFTRRREYAEWVATAKKPETRERRARKALAEILRD